MGYETKLVKNFTPIEHRRIGLGILAGLFIWLTYLSPSIFYSFPFSNVSLRSSSMNASPTSQTANDSGSKNVTQESLLKCNQELCEKGASIRINGNQSANASAFGKLDANSTDLLLGKHVESKDGNLTISESKTDQSMINGDIMVSKSSYNTTNGPNSTYEQVTSNQIQIYNGTEPNIDEGTMLEESKLDPPQLKGDEIVSKNLSGTTKIFHPIPKDAVSSNLTSQLDVKREVVRPLETKPLCDFSNRRSNICDVHGDIRIHGKSSSVISMITSTHASSSQRNESWQIRPYARKTDLTAMHDVRELTVKSSIDNEHSPRCSLNHSAPAVIFSVAGYTGNFFHDFTDVLVPLFLTSYQFNGEVQFLVANFRSWWIHKYLPIIKNLSKYELIDLDNDDRVHCFQHAIVGLNSHDDLKIDTWRSPSGYSMVDFTRFLRTAYSLPRESPLAPVRHSPTKPRLLILARSRTRKFTNLNKIVKMAEKSGFEVIVGEAESNVTHFAHIVNSCDVLLGVHGAGLTNFVFLPTNAILIQIVPWGRLDWIATTYFGEPAKGMKLRYMEYKIEVDESTLSDLYPRDHPVLKDPGSSVHKFGWDSLRETYLVKQNVKLNVRRFRPVLLKALKLLHQQ